MQPKDLAGIGRALYGEGWQTALSRDLEVSDRTVRRWAAGESAIPSGAQREIIDLIAARNLEQVLPIVSAMVEKYGELPEAIELAVYPPDSKLTSMHQRDWSYECDRLINSRLADFLTRAGIPAVVVEKR